MFEALFSNNFSLNNTSTRNIDESDIAKFNKINNLAYHRFKYNVSRKLFDILRNIRTKHGGDFEEYLILYALFLTSDYHRMMTSYQHSGNTLKRRPQGVNLLSISDITNIPRETVRRKVAKLVAEGSITRGDDGLHYYSGNAVQDDITARILEDLPIAHGASVGGVLADVSRTIGKAAGR